MKCKFWGEAEARAQAPPPIRHMLLPNAVLPVPLSILACYTPVGIFGGGWEIVRPKDRSPNSHPPYLIQSGCICVSCRMLLGQPFLQLSLQPGPPGCPLAVRLQFCEPEERALG